MFVFLKFIPEFGFDKNFKQADNHRNMIDGKYLLAKKVSQIIFFKFKKFVISNFKREKITLPL